MEKSQKKEDRLRTELEKSERYDKMSPAEKQAFDYERRAMFEASFTDSASTMGNIAQRQFNRIKQQDALQGPHSIQVKPKISDAGNLDTNDIAKIYTHERYKIGKGKETTIEKIQKADEK